MTEQEKRELAELEASIGPSRQPVSEADELAALEAEIAAPPQQAPEPERGVFRRAAETVGRQFDRVPAAVRGAAQAFQEGNPWQAPGMAVRGLVDPDIVQSSEQMMAGFGAGTDQTKRQIKTMPPGVFNFKTMDFTPAEPETTMVSPAQEYGAAFDALAPTGLELIPAVKAAMMLAKESAKGGVKIGAQAIDAARGTTDATDALKGAKQGWETYRTRQAAKVDEVLNPKFAPDAENYKRIGSALGFEADELSHPAIEFGENSVQARRNKVLAQGEGGGPILERHNAMTEKIQRGFDKAVESIGGRPLEPVQAGELIRQGVFEGAKRIADNVTATHETIMRRFPGLMVDGAELGKLNSAINGIEKFAKGRSVRGVVPEQRAAAESLLNSVEAIRSSKASYKQLNEAREMIGDIAFDNVGALGKIPAYQQKMRDLYFAINDALIETVGKKDRVRAGQFRKAGETFAPLKDELVKSNRILNDLFKDESALARSIGKQGKASESIFNEALLYGDTRKVQALRNVLTPEQFQALKGSYVNALVKRGKEGFTYKSAKNTLANNRSVLGEIFSDSPEQLRQISEIIDLGDRVGPPLLPGSAGQFDFGGGNSLARRMLDAVTAPVGDVSAEIGKVRAARGAAPRRPPLGLDASEYVSGNQGRIPLPVPLNLTLKYMREASRPNIPPYLNGGR